jgi:hypothetical protein
MFLLFQERPSQYKMDMRAHIYLVIDTITPLKSYFCRSSKILFGFHIRKVMIKEMLAGVV